MRNVVTAIMLSLFGAAAVFPLRPALAQQPGNPYENVRLARLGLIDGNVLMQRADDEEWVAASVNMPLRPHDKLWVTEGGRAEVQFDTGAVVRLAENTNVDLLALDPDFTQLQLTLGVATVSAHAPPRPPSRPFLELDTPESTMNVSEAVGFRADVAEDGSSEVTVRRGRLEMARDQEPLTVAADQRVTIEGGDAPRFVLEAAAPPDEWDHWNDKRDEQLAQAKSLLHLPPDVTMGASDLDGYGRWENVAPYGSVWVPPVVAGWAPYQSGRWGWVEPWGWTWISYEPWGWLPYHYGRWIVSANVGWVWVPGARLGVWAPGCVRFVYGPEWVGWVPLAPGEVYYYNPRPTVRVDINLINYRAAGGVTVVSRGQFVSGIPDHRFAPPRDVIHDGRMAVGPPPVVPTRESLRPLPERTVGPRELPPPQIRRAVVYSTPPSAPPHLFAQRLKEIQPAVEKGRAPIAASLPARGAGAHGATGTFSRTTVYKDITTHKVVGSEPPAEKELHASSESRPAPRESAKVEEPKPPRRVQLGAENESAQSERAGANVHRKAQSLYRMPPKPHQVPASRPSDRGDRGR